MITTASVAVRWLEESVKKQLAAQPKEHGRSMEAEIRANLAAEDARARLASFDDRLGRVAAASNIVVLDS